jgi:hypothetical protein
MTMPLLAMPRRLLHRFMHRLGYAIISREEFEARGRIPEISPEDAAVIDRVRPLTMTSIERIWACIQATRYASERGLAGDFVECGVWRGGSSMAAALTLLALGDTTRTLWLFDTFEGMTAPVDLDYSIVTQESATRKYETVKTDEGSSWCYASLAEVQANFGTTGYPFDRLRFIKGPVEQTLAEPANLPEQIAVLRLDTDWYESTRVELETLFDRVVPGGVLIIDDYGHWAGARKAVDEFLARQPVRYLLHRIDDTGRTLIKI